jgi:hypothetical protein
MWVILTAHRRRFGMKNPVYEQIQARKVKARLRMLQYAQRLSGNVSQTCRDSGRQRNGVHQPRGGSDLLP